MFRILRLSPKIAVKLMKHSVWCNDRFIWKLKYVSISFLLNTAEKVNNEKHTQLHPATVVLMSINDWDYQLLPNSLEFNESDLT